MSLNEIKVNNNQILKVDDILSNGYSDNLINNKGIYQLKNQIHSLSLNIFNFYNGHIKPDGTDGDYHANQRVCSDYIKVEKYSLLYSSLGNMFVFEYDDDYNFVTVNSNAVQYYQVTDSKIIRILLTDTVGHESFDLLDYFSYMRLSNSIRSGINFLNKVANKLIAKQPLAVSDLNWVHAHTDTNGNLSSYDAYRRMSSDIFFARKGTNFWVTNNSNISFFLKEYDADFNYVGDIGNTTTEIELPKDCFLRVVLINFDTNKTDHEVISAFNITYLDTDCVRDYKSIGIDSNSKHWLSFHHGIIDSNGNDIYGYLNAFTSNFHLFKKGDFISIAPITETYSTFKMYLANYDFAGKFKNITNSLGSQYMVQEDAYARLCVYNDTTPPSTQFPERYLNEYVRYYPKVQKSSIEVQNIKSSSVDNLLDKPVLEWFSGGYNINISEPSAYKYDFRYHSNIICAKKGDRILHERSAQADYGNDEILYIYILNSSYNYLRTASINYPDGRQAIYDVTEDCFIVMETFHNNDENWDGKDQLVGCVSYDRLQEGKEFDLSNFEHGSIYRSGGLARSDAYARNKNIVHVKRGTIFVPYVFGRYIIALYDDNLNFVKMLPEPIVDPDTGEQVAEGGQHNTGWFEQNAYEFKEDANIRLLLAWMPSASFYIAAGFENIIPNDTTVEHLVHKFKVIEPNYELPAFVKQAIVNKHKDIVQMNGMADMYKFTFITDSHEYAYHNAAAVFCANLTSRALLQGGDMLSWPQFGLDEGFEMVSRHVPYLQESKVPVLVTKGNHESTSTGTDPLGVHHTNFYTKQLWYEQMQLPFRRKEYVYNDTELLDQGYDYKDPLGGYFYYDDEIYKVRIICLDTFVGSGGHVMTTNQRIWIANKALDLSSKGDDEQNWAVIVFSHSQILDGDRWEPRASREERWCCDVFEACYNKTLTVISDPEFDPGYHEWTSLTPDFTNIKYQFVAYICGHVHYDSEASTANYNTEVHTKGMIPRDFLHISTTCDHPLENDDALRREWGTITEYVMDVYCLDKANRKLHIKRIGAGEDRELIY